MSKIRFGPISENQNDSLREGFGGKKFFFSFRSIVSFGNYVDI